MCLPVVTALGMFATLVALDTFVAVLQALGDIPLR